MGRQRVGQVERRVDRWVGRGMDRWRDWYTEGWTGAEMDRQRGMDRWRDG